MLVVGPTAIARADLPASCAASAGFDAQSASSASLQVCGIAKVPLSDTEDLPGGGVAYQYDLPDGQVVSYPQTPADFDALTASSDEDAAYGVPQAPAMVDTSYSSWAQMAQSWKLNPGESPYIYMYDVNTSLSGTSSPAASDSSSATPDASNVPGPNWAGYINNAGGWTRAEIEYAEPAIGVTRCTGGDDAFWAGVGGWNGDSDLGQDGTFSDSSVSHLAWFEVLPGGLMAFKSGGNDVIATTGDSITAITQYQGSSTYAFTLFINGTPYYADESGGYNSAEATADEIVERPEIDGDFPPLLNFGTVVINGYNGTGISPIGNNPNTQIQMTGFATTGSLSGAQFSVAQNNCSG